MMSQQQDDGGLEDDFSHCYEGVGHNMFEQDLLSNEEEEGNQTTFHQINDELLNTFIKEKEQERQQANSKKLSSTLESNGAMYYCLTVEDAVGGAVGLDTARYGAMTSTLQMSSTLDQLSLSTARQQTYCMGSKEASQLSTQRLQAQLLSLQKAQNFCQSEAIKFQCIGCGKEGEVLPYTSNPQLTLKVTTDFGGNCKTCGIFVLAESTTTKDRVVSQALRPADLPSQAHQPSLSKDISFQTETPMNQMLEQLLSRVSLIKIYNPAATYVSRRKLIVDWMCEVGEELRYRPEAIHHSVALFDAYYSKPNIEDIQAKSSFGPILEGKTQEQIMQLISVISMLISAKYLEMTYPGVHKFSQLTQSPFSYDDFIHAERHVLQVLHWQLSQVTCYDLLQHFTAQGIIFSTDSLISFREAKQLPTPQTAKSAQGFAEFFLEMCLQEYEFQHYETLTLACGMIMAARKMVKVLDKWPQELITLTGFGKSTRELSQIKRCMLQIFEVYEVTFPTQKQNHKQSSLSSSMTSAELISPQRWFQNDFALGSGGDRQQMQENQEEHKSSQLTTPTDVETPAKTQQFLLQAAKHYMSTSSSQQDVQSTLINTLEKHSYENSSTKPSITALCKDYQQNLKAKNKPSLNLGRPMTASFQHMPAAPGFMSTRMTHTCISTSLEGEQPPLRVIPERPVTSNVILKKNKSQSFLNQTQIVQVNLSSKTKDTTQPQMTRHQSIKNLQNTKQPQSKSKERGVSAAKLKKEVAPSLYKTFIKGGTAKILQPTQVPPVLLKPKQINTTVLHTQPAQISKPGPLQRSISSKRFPLMAVHPTLLTTKSHAKLPNTFTLAQHFGPTGALKLQTPAQNSSFQQVPQKGLVKVPSQAAILQSQQFRGPPQTSRNQVNQTMIRGSVSSRNRVTLTINVPQHFQQD